LSAEAILSTEILETAPRISEFKRFRKVFLSRLVVKIGLVIIVALITVAIFAPVLTPYDPYKPDLLHTLSAPSRAHPLGTDPLGRDTLSRIIYGARTSLIVGLIVVSLAATIGMGLGLLAGYFGGWTQMVIMRFVDTLMSFPMILLALVIAAMLGGGIKNVIIALTVGLTPVYSRLMRGQVLTIRENDYIMAEKAMGARNLRIMVIHLVPNCLPPLIVLITMMLGTTVLAEAGLSFLGVGIEPPTAAWGSMVNDGREYLLTHPILSFAPGLAIMLTVFAFNMVGDGLRDALDPRLRGTL
jgi:peptide/nickel transport system permease protein/oligopeptide transport system permease protein